MISQKRPQIARLAAGALLATAMLLGLLDATGSALPSAPAAGAAEWPHIELVPVADNLSVPINLVHAGDGSGRFFVGEQPGLIRIVQAGQTLPDPFLDIRDRVAYGAERGLLGLAYPPGFAQGGHFYVHYTDLQGDSVVSRFRVSRSDPHRADPSSEQPILFVEQPHHGHNGGQIAFGPDGYLYIGLGEGRWSSPYDPSFAAQDPTTLLGKVLRIDVETSVRTGSSAAATVQAWPTAADYSLFLPALAVGQRPAYAIPASNPFTATVGFRPEIWAMGLRNPWRFSFDRATGDLYIADVGHDSAEEINFQPASSPGGENYGWPIAEGSQCFLDPDCDLTGLTLPATEYGHAQGDCAIIGGYRYRGPANPALHGVYLFADLCSGRIRGLRWADGQWQSAVLLQAPFQISTFGEDEAGELYVADFVGGRILQVRESS